MATSPGWVVIGMCASVFNIEISLKDKFVVGTRNTHMLILVNTKDENIVRKKI